MLYLYLENKTKTTFTFIVIFLPSDEGNDEKITPGILKSAHIPGLAHSKYLLDGILAKPDLVQLNRVAVVGGN
jgi:hypothetical protein